MSKRELQWMTIEECMPSRWKEDPEKPAIWVSGFRAHGISVADLGLPPLIIDLDKANVRIVVFSGRLPYPVTEFRTRFDPQGRPQIKKSALRPREVSDGIHILFMTPVSPDKLVVARSLKQENMLFAVSLVATVCGRNAVFQHLFEQEISLEAGGARAYSQFMESPSSFGKPHVSSDQLEKVAIAAEKIALLSEFDRNKVHLSLRWYQMGFGELGVEAFLKYWIALEALCMTNRTSIDPLRRMLAKAYEMRVADVEGMFRIGRLFGIRGRIVHKGEFVPLHVACLRYMEALYGDLLFDRLSFPCERRAEKVLASNRSELSVLFPELH